MNKKITKRATGRSNKNRVSAWGIAEVDTDGGLNLIRAVLGRTEARDLKRDVYPGIDYKLVRIEATFAPYRK